MQIFFAVFVAVHRIAHPGQYVSISEGMTDDRCQWQMKGGRSFAEREMSANEVKRESCSEGRGHCTELTEANRNMLPRMGGLQG